MNRAWYIFLICLSAAIVITMVWALRDTVEITDTPVRIPTRQEIVSPSTKTDIIRTSDEARIPELLVPSPLVKQTTQALLSISCEFGTEQCKLQAVYDFVRLNYEHKEISPEHTHIQSPSETLIYNSGDSLELALLMASMQRAAGFENEIVIGPYHTFVRASIGNRTVIMDPSCQGCRFMDVRVSTSGREKIFK